MKIIPNSSLWLDLVLKAGMRLIILFVAAAAFACEAALPPVTETGDILKEESIALQDGRDAVVRFEKLTRSFVTEPGWFQGAGGEPSRLITHFYCLVTGTIQTPPGRTREFGWIAPFHSLSYFSVRTARLVIAGNDAFVEYTLVPTFENGALLPPESTPFNGNPRLLVKYAKYRGTKRHKARRDGAYSEFSATYKWPVEYVWEDISKEQFDEAAKSGAAASADFGDSEPFYHHGRRISYYSYFKERAEPDTEQSRFLDAVKSGNTARVGEMLNRNPELIRVYDYDGKTALHLALESKYRRHLVPLLYRFNPEINAVDFKGQTPLHTAARSSAGDAIKDELIAKGGKILYSSCKFRQLIDQYRLRFTVFKPESASNGWISDDVYQVWQECPVETGYRCDYVGVLAAAKDRIDRELGLSGAPESSISKKIGWIRDNIEDACVKYEERADAKGGRTAVERTLVRMCGPNLRGLVKEYNDSKRQSLR